MENDSCREKNKANVKSVYFGLIWIKVKMEQMFSRFRLIFRYEPEFWYINFGSLQTERNFGSGLPEPEFRFRFVFRPEIAVPTLSLAKSKIFISYSPGDDILENVVLRIITVKAQAEHYSI